MVDFSALTKNLVSNAINKQVPGLNSKVDFSFFVSQGVYDPASDTASPQYTTVTDVVCVEAGITMEDVSTYNITAKSKKLLVPAVSLPQVPEADIDSVGLGGKTWNIKKVREVPGGSLIIVYISET